jgi:molybdopterin molybdotransferase
MLPPNHTRLSHFTIQNHLMLELETARERILSLMPPPQPEHVPLEEAHRRILAEPLYSPHDLPPFDNSAMDGYAVRAEDLRAAQMDSPIALRLIGRAAAGEMFAGEVATGTCVRLFTGSAMPRGADAVVMQEGTRTDAASPESIFFLDAPRPWENVRFRGEDVKAGALLAAERTEVSASHISLLAAAGVTEICAGRRPIIGLLATGSELLTAGQPLVPGKIHESNRLTLATLISSAGGTPKIFPLVPDSPDETRRAFETAFAECDLVVTSGGVSVGEMDFVKSAFEEMGGTLEFWKIAMRPGKPFVFGHRRGKLLFGLPGNPVSAFVTFLLLVRPALLRWQGASSVGLPIHHGILAEAIANPADRRHFLRVMVDGQGKVRGTGMQGSHVLSSLAAANGLLDVPAKTTWPAGAAVVVMRW